MLLFAHVEPWIVQFKDVETTSSFKGDILDNPPRVYYFGWLGNDKGVSV